MSRLQRGARTRFRIACVPLDVVLPPGGPGIGLMLGIGGGGTANLGREAEYHQ